MSDIKLNNSKFNNSKLNNSKLNNSKLNNSKLNNSKLNNSKLNNKLIINKLTTYLDIKDLINLSTCNKFIRLIILPAIYYSQIKRNNIIRFNLINSFIKYSHDLNLIAVANSNIDVAIKRRDLDAVSYLVCVCGLKPGTKHLQSAITHRAITIVEYLIFCGVKINDNHIVNAACAGNYRIMYILLKEGGTAVSAAIKYAATNHNTAIIKLLLNHGATANIKIYKYISKHNLIKSLILIIRNDNYITAKKINIILSNAITHNYVEMARIILMTTNINMVNNELILDAIMLHRYKILKIMLLRGINNSNALKFAIQFGNKKIIKVLQLIKIQYYKDGSRKHSGGI